MSKTISDREGNVLGYQDRDGTVRDRDKKKIGSIHRRTGIVRDAHNQEVGFVDGDGNVIDRYRRRVGTIDPDGVVADWHGVEVYNGSAAPLLLDFSGAQEQARPEQFEFDEMARQPRQKVDEEQDEAEPDDPRRSRRRKVVGALVQEGFVSPSVIGCVGIVGAIAVGTLIIFLFQNPSILFGTRATPTARLSALSTPAPNATNGTASASAQETPAGTPAPLTGKVNTDILNLRSGPSVDFAILDRLPINTEVVMLGRLENAVWVKVNVPERSKEGWVATQYIDTEADVTTLPVLEAPTP